MGRAEDIFARIRRDGLAAIDAFIIDRVSEELFLDFKRSADAGADGRLHPIDRKNLGKLISAFGNSSGGVIVWGIDCSNDPKTQADLPRAKVPIKDVSRFVSRLESAVSGCTLPAHPTVSHFAIPLPGSTDGFVATLIPESSLCPHQAIGENRYYIRSGSNCEPAPHGVLAAMFGRKPVPILFPMFIEPEPKLTVSTVKFAIGFVLAHKTPAIARDIHFSIFFRSTPGPSCSFGWARDQSGFWTWNNAMGVRFSGFTGDQFKLPPEMLCQVGTADIVLEPPFERKLMVEMFYGCLGSPIGTLTVEVEAHALEAAWSKYVRPHILGPKREMFLGREFIHAVFPVGENAAGV